MSVAVLIKQVPDTTAKIDISGGFVDGSAVSKWSISPYDEYALEAALQIKEAGDGDLIAITCGPSRASKALTEAAAVGADILIHIEVDLENLDSVENQSLLAAAVRHSGAEVVFCGKQAADTNAGSTGPGVARLLGSNFVGMVSEVSPEEGSFLASRMGPNGGERVSVSSPCLFAFDKGTTELRRPNVRGIMMAKKKQIENLSPSDLGIEVGGSSVVLRGHSSPPQKAPGQKFEGADSIPEVVSKLREEANVI